MTLVDKLNESTQMIRQKTDVAPQVGMILGSGLGDLADEIENATYIDYDQIPHFPESTVEGHAGRLVLGELQGKQVVAMQGRFHYYEGYPMQDVVFPVYVMKQLGVSTLLVTNACGGMNPDFSAGDLMLIEDHINFTGANPLIGPNDDALGPRFPDMSHAYTPELVQLMEQTAQKLNIDVQKGVYAGISGPNYMSRAELDMLAKLGGDAVGMSTVGEVIAASHADLKVMGISCVTDMAIASELEGISHEEVMEMAAKTKPKFISFVKEIVKAVE